jgi:Flp pilus assembly pilin Flp
MTSLLHRILLEDDGVLSFEWTLLSTLLAIGIVGGISAARDAIVDELGDTAQVMLAVDQSYHIGMPLRVLAHDTNSSSSADSGFIDAALYSDCVRPLGDLPAAVLGQDAFFDFDS